jgi:predicted transcriptional regulator
VKTTEALQKAVGSAVKMMTNFNKLTGGPQLVSELRELEKQNMTMNVQSEIIDEQLDSVFEEDNDEDAPEDVVMQVMEEAGVKLPSASCSVESSIEERLEKLKPAGMKML